MKGEVIGAGEKIFSIFEPHTEWISKGKLNKKVELGHLVLITTDQNSFIVDYKIMEKQKDAQQINDLSEGIKTKFADALIASYSFDKGFWSKDNLAHLEKQKIAAAVLPKRGRHTTEDKKRESEAEYKMIRKKHSV